jgi:hypothetical protein
MLGQRKRARLADGSSAEATGMVTDLLVTDELTKLADPWDGLADRLNEAEAIPPPFLLAHPLIRRAWQFFRARQKPSQNVVISKNSAREPDVHDNRSTHRSVRPLSRVTRARAFGVGVPAREIRIPPPCRLCPRGCAAPLAAVNPNTPAAARKNCHPLFGYGQILPFA